jgi:hypothetical protein
VKVPLGMQLVYGTRVIIDTNPPQRNPTIDVRNRKFFIWD